MDVSALCKSYFNGFQEVRDYKNSKFFPLLKIASYFTVAIPLGVAAIWGVASIIGRVSKKGTLTSQEQEVHSKAHEILGRKKEKAEEAKSAQNLSPNSSETDFVIELNQKTAPLLKERGIECVVQSGATIFSSSKTLHSLPKGSYYVLSVPTDRVFEYINEKEFTEFQQKHPAGIILAFRFAANPAMFSSGIHLGDGETIFPYCFLLHWENDPLKTEIAAFNAKVIERIKNFKEKGSI